MQRALQWCRLVCSLPESNIRVTPYELAMLCAWLDWWKKARSTSKMMQRTDRKGSEHQQTHQGHGAADGRLTRLRCSFLLNCSRYEAVL